MKKHKIFAAILVVVFAAVLFCGCGDKREDTRKYVRTIGVVFTNDIDEVFQELFVYPGSIRDMGEDRIGNAHGVTRVGSYGVTLEVSDSYNVWLKDRDGGSYEFDSVALQNGDMAVITYDDKLLLTVHHQNGETEIVQGGYVPPGDAPDHPQSDLKREESFKFNVQNNTGGDIIHLSMREAAHQDKGEVELHLDTLKDGKMVSISHKLDEADTEIVDWVLQATASDGKVYVSEDAFSPWDAAELTLTLENGKLLLAVEAEK